MGYNTLIVMIAAGLLGAGAGAVGVFALLRRRALLSDALGHATLPGIGLGFMILFLLDMERLPWVLMASAASTAWLGAIFCRWIKQHGRLSEDAAIAATLGYFYAAGIVLLSIIQTLPGGMQAGIGSFLLGAASSIHQAEVWMIAMAIGLVLATIALSYRHLNMLCFDRQWMAVSTGSSAFCDHLLNILIVIVAVMGLYTVGLVLIVALIIIPAATARLWITSVGTMIALAMVIGVGGSIIGVWLSLLWHMPTGASIVLTLSAIFGVSFIVSPQRGLVYWLWCHHGLAR